MNRELPIYFFNFTNFKKSCFTNARMKHLFAYKIINWYQINKRDLPWRKTTNPYYIWLSEIILQQTRVAQGLPYYKVFVEKFPTVQDLANATEEEVLKLWQGLGYYSRARNLHFTAKLIVNEYKGNFPKTYSELLQLKGVGDYTAAAIASFCFKEKTPTVDGNVYRVLARYFGVETPINLPKAKKEFKALATALIDPKQPALFNQAIMEFGALQCTPKQPKCTDCVLADSCVALQKKQVSSFPFKNKKIKVRKRYFNCLVLQTKANKTLLHKRVGKGIWQNLYEFPLVETSKEIGEKELLKEQKFIDFVQNYEYHLKQIVPKPIVHKLSHQHLHITFWLVSVSKWNKHTISWSDALALPTPIIIHKFLERHFDYFSK